MKSAWPRDRASITRRRVSCVVCLAGLALGLAAGASPAHPAEPSRVAQSAAQLAAAAWESRLARLDPVRPLDYLELAEEVADAARDEEDRALARQLFGLAGALDPTRLGRSAMLALATLARDEPERQRALAAAELVGGRGLLREEARVDPAQIESLARSFSYYRRGDGRRALAALRQGGGEELLDAVGAALPAGADGYREECKAMRGASPAPPDASTVLRQHEIELALRMGRSRAVSLDLALLGDDPLVEVDLADPGALWGVDPTRPWWREGAWRGNG
ncbi:MAG: hypothetical protein GC172_00480 [Phycisphaera sp.]|nr:hypothetical protein [Phycisphaera sp.]